jgi:HTH-type transcriptional regulator/antitoxin HigA
MTEFKPDWGSPPGDTIADILKERRLDLREAATRAGMHPVTLSALLRGEAAIGPAEAAGLAKLTGASSEFWLEREKQYRLWLSKGP